MQWVKRAIVCMLPLMVVALVGTGIPVEGQGSAGFMIIANSDLNVAQFSKGELSKIFLKKMSRYQGTSLAPADQARGSTVREAFSEAIHGRSVNAIKSYWQRQIFSGRETPPPELGSDADVINHVTSNPGGIGYVSVGTALNGTVQVQVAN